MTMQKDFLKFLKKHTVQKRRLPAAVPLRAPAKVSMVLFVVSSIWFFPLIRQDLSKP